MGLSDYEQRVFAEMEAQLREDLNLSTLDRRRLTAGLLLIGIGITSLLGGVNLKIVLMGILGWIAMLAGTLISISAKAGGFQGINQRNRKRLDRYFGNSD